MAIRCALEPKLERQLSSADTEQPGIVYLQSLAGALELLSDDAFFNNRCREIVADDSFEQDVQAVADRTPD